MNLFSFLKKKPFLSVIFDIREFSLSMAVVRMSEGKKMEMLYCQDFDIEKSELSAYKNYTASLLKALDESLVNIRKTIVKMGVTEELKQFFFFIGSPWIVSKSKSIKFSKDKNFVINDKLLKRILLGQEAGSQKEVEDEKKHKGWKMLEENIIQAKLNGYKVEKIYNKKTKDFEVHLFTSFIPKEISDKIEFYMENKEKGKPKYHSYSQTLSTFTFIRDFFPNKDDFIYVDIGKLITDLYIVRNDIIQGISSFPIGEDAILENITKKTKTNKEVFLSLLNIKCHNKCDDETEDKIKLILTEGMKNWSQKFKETFEKICTEKDTPSDIMMLAKTDFTQLLVKRLSDKNYEHTLRIYGKKPIFSGLNENILNNFISGGKFFKNQPFIKIDLVFLDKLIKQKALYV